MKLVKRLGLILLALSMTITAFAEEPAQEAAELIDMTGEEAIVLKALSILDASGKEAGATVTRSEFANAIVMTVNEKLPAGVAENDLKAKDGGLYWLMSRNMIHGNGSGEFRPDDVITVAEAVKISLSMLGYDKQALLDGGYPMGYMTLAGRLKLLGGVSGNADDALTYESFVSLLYNVTDCEIMEVVFFTTDGYSGYEVKENETLLSVYRDIYKEEGIITANEATGLYAAEDKLEKGEVRIGDKKFYGELAYTSTPDSLGLNTVYYYRKGKAEDVLMCVVPRDNKVLRINAVDILGYAGGRYSYTTDGTNKKDESIDSSTIIIYNGVFAPDNQVFEPEYGSIELVDNNGGGWDVLKIRDAKLLITDRTLAADGRFSIFDKFNPEYNEVVEDYTDTPYRAYDVNGVKCALESINSGNVIEVEKSAGNKPYYRVTLSLKTVDSQISSMSNDKKYLTLANGEKYETTPRFTALVEENELELIYNKQCKIYLTPDNRVAYFDYGLSDGSPLSWRIGYLHKFEQEELAFEKVPRVRMLDQGGSWETYKFAESVKINEDRIKAENIDLSGSIGGLLKYMLNIHGEISEIYLPAGIPENPAEVEMDENFQLVFNGNGTRQYYPTGWTIAAAGKYIAVASNLPIFIKSSAESDADLTEEQIKVTGYTIMGDGYGTYSMKVYCTNGKPGTGHVAIISSPDKTPTLDRRDNRPIAVNEIAEAITEDGTPVYAVKGFRAGVEVTINVEDQRADKSKLPFKKGDIIYLIPDISGIVTLRDDVMEKNPDTGVLESVGGYSYGVLCGYDEKGELKAYNSVRGEKKLLSGKWGLSYNDNDAGAQNIRTILGKVYDVEGNKVYVNDDNLADWTKIEPLNIPSYEYVYIWDEINEVFRVGTIAEAVGYKYDKENASDIYVVNANQYMVTVIYP